MRLWERVLRLWAERAGYELASLPLQSERLGVHLQLLIRKLNINCVFDVGANRGQYGRFLREWGYKGRIISFEPVSADFAVLKEQAAADPDWQAHQIALGETEAEKEINVTSDSLFNSFLEPSAFIIGQGLRVEQRERVRIRPLDALFDQCLENITDPQPYLKLDTQGYDFKVLGGAKNAIQHIAAMQVELSVKAVYKNAPYYLEGIGRLEEMGFEVTGLFPIARDNALRVLEFDCVMVRTAVVGETTGVYPP
jgi:FkbM family methyltransferase